MLFVLFFVSCILIVPLLQDSNKHGADNILRRSGRDLLNYNFVQSTFNVLHISAKQAGALAIGLVALAALPFLLFIALKILSVIFGILFYVVIRLV